jgi:hypothetical protein
MPEDQNVHSEAGRWGGWFWREPSRGEHFRRCSYCGSVHPADLAAEPGWRAEWADRKYGWPHKFYVAIANRDPEAPFTSSSTWNKHGEPGRGETLWDDLTAEQRALYNRDHGTSHDGRHPTSVGFGPKLYHFGKFYSVHLSDPAIDAAVKDEIERRSGLAFTFTEGRVSWRIA